MKELQSDNYRALIKRTLEGDIKAIYELMKFAPEDIDSLFVEVKNLSDGELFKLG